MSTSHKKQTIQLTVRDIENNVYYKDIPAYFLELKALIEKNPRTYVNKLKASGKFGPSFKYLLNWIEHMLPQLEGFQIPTKCNWIFNNVQSFPLCKNSDCRKEIKTNYSVTCKLPSFCCRRCQLTSDDFHTKRLATWKKKYGEDVVSPLQAQPVKEKIKTTNLERYGVEYVLQSKEVQEKSKQTCLKNHGTEFPMQSVEVQKKAKQTKLQHFGDENFNNLEKAKQTKLERYNDENYVNPEKAKQTRYEKNDGKFELAESAEKRAQTNLKQYGAKYATQSDIVKEKTAQTNIKKYGKKCTLQVESIIEKGKQTKLERYNDREFRNSEKATQTKKSFSKEKKLEIQQKTIETNLKTYGVKYTTQSEQMKTKSAKTLMERYGVSNPSQCHSFRSQASKQYKYDGKLFSSAPEVAYYIWLLDNSIDFTYQPDISFVYSFDGKQCKYFPDFIVENEIVEIKGDQFFKEDGTMFCPFRRKDLTDEQYQKQCEKYEAKHQCMLKNSVKILRSADYHQYIEYVDDTYGKKFLRSLKTSRKV